MFREIERASRELTRSMSVYSDMVRQLQLSPSLLTSLHLQDSIAKQLVSDHTLMNMTTPILSQAGLNALATQNFSDLAIANQNLAELVSKASISDSIISKAFAEHNALRTSLKSIASQTVVSDLLSSLDTTKILHTSLTSQFRLLGLEAHSIGKLLGASAVLANDLTATFSNLTRSYRDVIESIPQIPDFQVPLIAKYSPLEYSLQLDVLERISVEEDKPETTAPEGLPSVDEELASFDDKLLNLINGARESLKSDNPDRARHVTTSARELFTHVLHGLAPDAKIKKWTNDANNFHDNRPTRRARLLYICRNFSCGPLSKFVEDDVRAALTLIDSLNAGTHVVESKLTTYQLEAIVYRMEALALFLLKISRGQ